MFYRTTLTTQLNQEVDHEVQARQNLARESEIRCGRDGQIEAINERQGPSEVQAPFKGQRTDQASDTESLLTTCSESDLQQRATEQRRAQ